MYKMISDFVGTFPGEFSWIVPIAYILLCLLVIYALFYYPYGGGKK